MNMTGPDGVEFDGMELKFEINFSNQLNRMGEPKRN